MSADTITVNGTHRVELAANGMGRGSVVVDGVDLTGQLSRVTVDVHAGQTTKVFLEARAGLDTDLTVDGEVFQQIGELDPGPAILGFLQSVDVQALEQAAMVKLEGLDGTIQSPMAAALLVLQEWAGDGNHDRT